MQADEEYRACPSPTCSWACFMSKKDGNIFVCQMCSYRYCMSCEAPMHEEETCAQYQARLKSKAGDESLSLAKVNKTSKACPNKKCQARFNKYAGHVTCKKLPQDRTCDAQYTDNCSQALGAITSSAGTFTLPRPPRRTMLTT